MSAGGARGEDAAAAGATTPPRQLVPPAVVVGVKRSGDGDEVDLSLRSLDSDALEALWSAQFEEEGLDATLTCLGLDNNLLTRVPASLGHYQQLRWLHLNDNRLVQVPEAVVTLSRLEVLHLQHNRIASLPPTISSLRSLTVLSLYANRIAELPEEIGDLPLLESLLLSRNRIARLPAAIYRLTSLQDLAIDHNRLAYLPPNLPAAFTPDADTDAAATPALSGWAALTTLDISHNRLRALPDGFGARALPSLRDLFLDGNQLRWLPFGVLTLMPYLDLFSLRRNPIVQGQPYDADEDEDDDEEEGEDNGEGVLIEEGDTEQSATGAADESGVSASEDNEDVDGGDDNLYRTGVDVVESAQYAVPHLVDLCCRAVATTTDRSLPGMAHQQKLPQELRLRLPESARSCVHCGQLFYGLPSVTAVLRRVLMLTGDGRFMPLMGDSSSSSCSELVRLLFRSSFCSASCCRARVAAAATAGTDTAAAAADPTESPARAYPS